MTYSLDLRERVVKFVKNTEARPSHQKIEREGKVLKLLTLAHSGVE